MNDNTSIITGKSVCFCYLNVFEPKSYKKGEKPKYSLMALISKDDTFTLTKVEAAIEAAYFAGQNKLMGNDGVIPSLGAIPTPLKDGEREHPGDPIYAGRYFINASSYYKPEVVDSECKPIIDASEIYGGIFGRVSLNFYAYNHEGKCGIGCQLQNLQKNRDGERITHRSSAKDDFANLSGDEEDDFFA
nr:DUF2815 family protein [Ruminococcus flavefaciens]